MKTKTRRIGKVTDENFSSTYHNIKKSQNESVESSRIFGNETNRSLPATATGSNSKQSRKAYVNTKPQQKTNKLNLKPILSPEGAYCEQIISHLMHTQHKYRIQQDKIASRFLQRREEAINYFFKARNIFQLKKETVYLAVYVMDKFLVDLDPRQSSPLTVIVQAVLLLCMKYSEIYPPQMDKYVSKKDQREVIQLQSQILKKLDFELCYFSAYDFYQYWHESLGSSNIQDKVALLLLDLSLYSPQIYQFNPATISYSALDVARRMSKGPGLSQQTFVDYCQMLECCRIYMKLLHTKSNVLAMLIDLEHASPQLMQMIRRS